MAWSDHRRLKVFHFISDSISIRPYLEVLGRCSDPQKFEVSYGSLSPSGLLQQELGAAGFKVLALGCTTRQDYPRAIWRLRNWLVAEQIDVIQTHLFEGSLVGLAAARLAGVPLAILSGHHSHEIALHHRKIPLWADRIATNWLAHRIIAYSTQMRDTFVREEGVGSGKIGVLPFPIDLSGWTRDEAYRAETRKRLGLEGKIILGAVGRMFWVKDYDLLLRAFVAIAAKWQEAALVLIGDGPDRAQLQRLAQELSISDRVTFVDYQSDLPRMMTVMDVFVHPSRAEAFCQVIVHAFSLGIPVISTDVGVARELVEDGVTGVLVPPGDLESLRNGLEVMMVQRALWREMGAEGRRRIERFSAAPAVARHEEQYVAWLDEQRQRR